ncbi:MAG: FAD synthetase family protein [Clostridiales bacterium]|jgi:riboflavin kinase/FMN adenylyltransferase|nr:FAD synthetase family protein [Clostridiales bacterium]
MIVINHFLKMMEGCSLTIGKFDGLHVGHMSLIHKIINYGRELEIPSVVFTFERRQNSILHQNPPILTDEQKFYILEKEGLDILIQHPFDKLFGMSAEEFCDNIFNVMKCRALVVGKNFRFGSQRKGDVESLRQYAREKGALLDVQETIIIDGEPVSSSRIRKLVENKDFTNANRLLGRKCFS